MNQIERELQKCLPDMYPPVHGQLSQRTVTPEMLAAYREYQQQLRLLQDLQHQQRNEQIGKVCLGIGALFCGAIGLLLAGAIFAAANRPVTPPPPRINENCILFCGGGNR